MKPNFERFDPVRVGNSIASIKDGLVKPFQKLHDFVRLYGSNGLTLEDNMRAVVMENIPLVHGVEYVFDRPKTLPYPKWCRLLDSTLTGGVSSLPVASLQLNKARTDGRLGITAYFDGRHTEPCLIMTKSAPQSINNNTTTTVTGWDTTQFSRGSVITTDGTTFTFSEAGTYHVAFLGFLQLGASYTAAQAWIDAPTTQEVALTYLAAPFTDGPIIQVSGIMRIAAAGQTCIARIFQTNAAAVARNLNSGANSARIAVNRLYNDTVTGYSANVTFSLGDA